VIDLNKLNRIHLDPDARVQRFFARAYLKPNYGFPGKRTRIVLEGLENIPRDRAVVFLMNHTDRFNYWPFQYQLWREGFGYVSPWVKGKYYQNAAISWFLDACNNIPVPSKGYVLTKDFEGVTGRLPSDAEYEALKRLTDGALAREAAESAGGESVRAFLERDWGGLEYAESFNRRFEAMMRRLVDLSRDALSKRLHLLIFPQGTRSVRLLPGHTGAAQFLLHSGATAVPVGCNGSDKAYPGNAPWSRGGTIVYRIGKPLSVEDELKPYKVEEPFVPFSRDAEKHEASFRGATDLIMSRINALLDPPYQFAPEVDGTKGVKRFV
jgi:1-acyl-sn-glycerol-3-phosphate acyltransferase